MIIGIIGGTGKQGSALAKRWAKEGYDIKIGSRSEERGRVFARDIGKNLPIRGGDNAFACESDVIVLAVPFQGITDLLDPIKSHFVGKVVFDLTVPLKPGKFMKVDLIGGKSAHEFIRTYLDQSRVVACLKTISAIKLDSLEPLNQTDFIISTDDNSYNLAAELSSAIGLSPVRVRGKFHAHTLERMVALAIQINKEYSGSHAGYNITDLILSS